MQLVRVFDVEDFSCWTNTGWGEVSGEVPIWPPHSVALNCGHPSQWHYTQCGPVVAVMFSSFLLLGPLKDRKSPRSKGNIHYPKTNWGCPCATGQQGIASPHTVWKVHLHHHLAISKLWSCTHGDVSTMNNQVICNIAIIIFHMSHDTYTGLTLTIYFISVY